MKEPMDDSGLAYGYMMIMLYFGMAVAIWVCWGFIYDNFLVMTINPTIVAGDVTVQTASATEWNVNFIRYAVPIILLFGFVFSINWAIYKSGGGMATFSTFWWGFLVFVIFCVAGLIMSFWGGFFLDSIIEETSTLPHQCHGTGDTGIGCQMQQDIYWFINLYYLVCYIIPVLGAVIFGQSIVKRVRMSQYDYR